MIENALGRCHDIVASTGAFCPFQSFIRLPLQTVIENAFYGAVHVFVIP